MSAHSGHHSCHITDHSNRSSPCQLHPQPTHAQLLTTTHLAVKHIIFTTVLLLSIFTLASKLNSEKENILECITETNRVVIHCSGNYIKICTSVKATHLHRDYSEQSTAQLHLQVQISCQNVYAFNDLHIYKAQTRFSHVSEDVL